MMTLGNVVSTSNIKLIADFISVLCNVVAEFLVHWIVARRKEIGEIVPLATVIHKYSDAVVGVEIDACLVKIGDELLAVHSQMCRKVKILSIQSEKDSLIEIQIEAKRELGLRLDQPVPKDTVLMRDLISKTAPVVDGIIQEPLFTEQPQGAELPTEEIEEVEIRDRPGQV